MTIFISLLLIALVILLYLKERNLANFKLPFVLRILVLLFLILILIGSVFRFNFTRSARIPILILVDASKSMSSIENPRLIEEVINKVKLTNYRVRIFSFADSIGKMLDYQNPTGLRTDIAQALNFAHKQKPGAIVLISDGQHNYGSDPINYAKNSVAPIYTIGIGPKQKNDLSIEQIRHPIRCFQGDTIDINAHIKYRGFDNQVEVPKLVKISLFTRERLIASQTVNFVRPNIIQEVAFRIVAETSGRRNYSLRIESLPEEDNYQNNRKNFIIDVLKGRWQIIYFTNAPSYNTRFILSTLRADKNFTVHPLINFVANETKVLTDQPKDKLFTEADVLIIDNVSELRLDNTMRNYLQKWIAQSKGILILSGENYRAQTFLNEIAPFEFDRMNVARKEYFFNLTDEGIISTLFTTATGANLLDNTPPLWGISVPTKIKPDAIIWAKSNPDSLPLIGYRKYKNCKTILITGFPIWRLGFSAIETERINSQFQNFLTNLIRFLAIKEVENFRLLTNKNNYLAGEEVVFQLIATTPNGKPWSNLDAKILISDTKISLPLFEISPGNYEGSIQTLLPGTYQVVCQITQDNKPIGTAKTTITINEQSVEDITGLNADLLQSIAQASNGRYYSYEEFIQEPFTPQLAKYQRRFSLAISYNPYIYIIIALIFSLGLFLRKKAGLL